MFLFGTCSALNSVNLTYSLPLWFGFLFPMVNCIILCGNISEQSPWKCMFLQIFKELGAFPLPNIFPGLLSVLTVE